jgi:spore cortex formation protein SpoVR/YcgB (stage V sporulation)
MKEIIFLLVSCLLFSCNNTESRNENRKTIEVIRQLSPDADFSKQCIVLIIPFDGCSSCFDAAVHLIPEVTDKQNIIIMPSRHKRRVYNFLNDFGLEAEEVVTDTMLITVGNNLANINPVLFIIENDVIKYKKIVEHANMKEIRSMLSELTDCNAY